MFWCNSSSCKATLLLLLSFRDDVHALQQCLSASTFPPPTSRTGASSSALPPLPVVTLLFLQTTPLLLTPCPPHVQPCPPCPWPSPCSSRSASCFPCASLAGVGVPGQDPWGSPVDKVARGEVAPKGAWPSLHSTPLVSRLFLQSATNRSTL